MIEIVSREKIVDEELNIAYWYCWLEISRNTETWAISATAPDELEEAELQAHFEGMEAEVWQVAVQKQYQPDATLHLRERELLKRLVKVILSEINILRDVAGLPPRTLKQLKRALVRESGSVIPEPN